MKPFYSESSILISERYLVGFLVGRSKKILNIPHDRANIRDFKTDLHFAETSSRPSKATLKVVKIATFTQQNLPEGREIE